MEKLEKLTPEQEAMIPVFLKRYEDMFYKNEGVDKKACEKGIEILYDRYLNKPKPQVMYMDSFFGVQVLISILKNKGFNGANLRDNYEQSSYWANIGDYGWVAFYDFIQYTGHFVKYNYEPLNDYRNLLASGLYEIHVFDGLCIVSSMPKVKQDERKGLHCEDGPAATWGDGFSMWYYHGMPIPGHWIEDKASITAEEIKKESNAEKRRALRDLLGADRYYELLGGVNELDRNTDNQGHEMVLYESRKIDSVVNKKIQFLEVVCPSTMRKYVLYPTRECKNVWEAKVTTFRDEKIQYRHGDVALLNLEKTFNNPICES